MVNSTDTSDNNETLLVPAISKPEVYHTYDLRNEGPGLLPGAYVEVLVPVLSRDGQRLLEFSVEV